VAFGSYSARRTIDKEQKATSCSDVHIINELTLIEGDGDGILQMFLGETCP